MNIDWKLVVDVVKELAWPAIAAFALYYLRPQLIDLIGQLARRATKVSILDISVELATLPELNPTWSVGDNDPRRLSSSQIFDSSSFSLFTEIVKPVQSDYVIVDLRSGDAWLTSRLFIFSLILGEVAGLRAIVFLEKGNVRRRFLGVSTPSNVRRALGKRYPWFEDAFARAVSAHSQFMVAQPWQVSGLVKQFIDNIQKNSAPSVSESNSYLKIGTGTGNEENWEQTRWIDGEQLERDLAGVLEYAWVDESPDTPRHLVSEAILRRNASFVALVDSDRRFVGLVDRYTLLSKMALERDRTARRDRGAS